MHVIFATTDPSAGWGGIQAFVVDKGNPGLKAGKKERKMGVRASHTGEVILEHCFVPDENLLGGERGRGGIGVLKTLESTRPGVGAGALGIARAAHEYAAPAPSVARRGRSPVQRRGPPPRGGTPGAPPTAATWSRAPRPLRASGWRVR